MKTEPNDPITGLENQLGLTKREYIMIELTKAYICAGSNGMPSPKDVVRYAADTYNELIAELNKEDSNHA